jgi:hypothetical protein
MTGDGARRLGIWALPSAAVFVLLATLNAAGYRYAASDQAFYIPAVVRHLDPAVYPRDAPLIDSQAKLTVVDEAVAGVVRSTGVSLQHLFLVLYITALLLLAGAAARIGSRIYRSGVTAAALVAALTLRHAIAKTGANTLEAYFHPRQLAFALGLWGVALFLERRERAWPILLAGAALVHPTTAVWFGVWLGVAAFAGRPRWRLPLVVAAAALAIGAAIAAARGLLSPALVRMDPEWLAAIGDKDLFPLAWPANVWLTNLAAVPVIVMAWRARRRAGLLIDGETPLVLGAAALVVLFLCWLPFDAAHVALAVQAQAARVFWLLDVFGTVYLIWWLAEASPSRRPPLILALVLASSIARGVFACFIEFPDRPIFAVDIQPADWRDAMQFAASTDPRSGWLADPIHAARYGSSLRAAGRRDVLIEELKDRAIAMYDRGVALRVAERLRALQELRWNTPAGARALARRFDLDYLIADRELDLPLAHRSGSLFIYYLRQ